MPTISWSGRPRHPAGHAKLVAVAIVSVSDTMRDPHGPNEKWSDVGPLRPRQASGTGHSLGQCADRLHSVCGKVEDGGDDRDARPPPPDTAGTRLVIRGRTSSTARTHSPVTRVVRLVSSSP